MKIIAIIPARGGSKGVPGKNIKLLGHKPLIAYTIESAISSKLLHTIMVSSDCDKIIAEAEKYGAEVPYQRATELAQDNTPTLDVVQDVILYYEKNNMTFDAVCLLQPTSPFRETNIIDKAIQQFIESGADSLISVLPVPHEYNPHWVFEVKENGYLKIATGEENLIARRQELPQTFHRDGSIYITKTEVIKSGSLYGNSISFICNNPEYYVNIDTLEDWSKAEQLLKSR